MEYLLAFISLIIINILPFGSLKEYDCKLPIAAALLLEQNMLIALKCYQAEYGYWSYKGLNNGDINDRQNRYYVRPGLIGDFTISLESSINRGFFWRVRNGKLNLEAHDGSRLFKEEASFIPVPGLEDYHLLSLRSYKYPRKYVRHHRDRIIVSDTSNNNLFIKDATWNVYNFDSHLR